MKSVFSIAIASMAVFSLGNSYSASLTKTDFASGIELQLEAHQLYEFSVTSSIYQQITQRNLNDLRIFDPTGGMVPIKILTQHHVETRNSEPLLETKPLTFFPVIENQLNPVQDLNVYLQRNNEGTIVNINSSQPEPQSQKTSYYIVDRGKPSPTSKILTTRSLIIEWDTSQVSKAVVTVETSSDLSNWKQCGSSAVFHLQHNNQILSQKKIPVGTLQRYLKVSFDKHSKAALKSIHQVTQQQIKTKANVRSGSAQLVKSTGTQYDFHIPGNYPIHSLTVLPVDDNAVYQIKLFNGDSINTINTLSFAGTIYKLIIGDKSVTSKPLPVSHNKSYWRLLIDEYNQAIRNAPKLEFNYSPHKIRFLSNQAGNYTVAFGNTSVTKSAPAIPSQIESAGKQNFITIELTQSRTMGGLEKLQTPPAPKNYKKIILWLILALVLAVMSFMVLRLMKHMKNDLES